MHKITAKSSIRPEFTAIEFTPEGMTATDSFRLLHVEKPVQGITDTVLMRVPGFVGAGDVSIDGTIVTDGKKQIVGTVIDANYPDWRKVVPTDAPLFTMKINASMLAELAAAVAKIGGEIVTLEFRGETKPLTIKGKQCTALQMPLNQ